MLRIQPQTTFATPSSVPADMPQSAIDQFAGRSAAARPLPATTSLVLPHFASRDPKPIGSWLAQQHHENRATIRDIFSDAETRAAGRHWVINFVTANEGSFLGDYLGVTASHILTLATRKLHAKRDYVEIMEQIIETLLPEQTTDARLHITFVGHMQRNRDSGGELGRLTAAQLARCFANIRIEQVNFFSCYSSQYAQDFAVEHARARAPYQEPPLSRRVYFSTMVAPWPAQPSRSKPLAFFYAGTEIGYQSCRHFDVQRTQPVLPHVKQSLGCEAGVPDVIDAQDTYVPLLSTPPWKPL